MTAIKLPLTFFTELDGNAMSIDDRIAQAINLLQGASDYLVFGDDLICKDEAELRALLTERGIL